MPSIAVQQISQRFDAGRVRIYFHCFCQCAAFLLLLAFGIFVMCEIRRPIEVYTRRWSRVLLIRIRRAIFLEHFGDPCTDQQKNVSLYIQPRHSVVQRCIITGICLQNPI